MNLNIFMKKILLIIILNYISIIGYASDYIFYKGNSTIVFDIVYTIKDNKIYKGRGTGFSDNIIFTINNDDDIYKVILPLLLMRKSSN